MNILIDHAQLARLIANLQALTGIRANILDPAGCDIGLTSGHTSFCCRINADPAGHARCLACDAAAARACTGQEHFYFYRCHAGLQEAMLPLDGGDPQRPMAFLAFGQFLEDSPREPQWQQTRQLLCWLERETGQSPDDLREDFFALRRYPAETLRAYAEILEALAGYIRLKGMILPAEQGDAQRLEAYLDAHYTEKLTLAGLCAELQIGRTKLCRLAKELSGGHTLSWLIAQRRIEAAKGLLLQSSLPISVVAERVGVSDYNYFSRLFRTVTGTTPRQFRRKKEEMYNEFGENDKKQPQNS